MVVIGWEDSRVSVSPTGIGGREANLDVEIAGDEASLLLSSQRELVVS